MGNITLYTFSYKKMQFLLLLSLLMILLSSCTTVSKKDGPPNFYVDASRVPDAVPKVEPLSKYGNYSSYVVFGNRYHTLKTSKHYDEIGTASWYGTKFDARRTSSGERYNMLGMTAAHKTLPLPTYVEVTNLENKHKIIVKVNDRGPFAQNRIIDLSYVAARKLGMAGRGTARVRVKAIDLTSHQENIFAKQDRRSIQIAQQRLHSQKRFYSQKSFSSQKSFYSQKRWEYFQVGAFRSKHHADQLKYRLTTLLKTHVQVHAAVNGLYRVKIGPIRDISTAKRLAYRLKNLRIAFNKTEG